MPGCTQHAAIHITAATIANGGHAAADFPVPNDPRLLGLVFSSQAIVNDPTANAFGAVVSNAGVGADGAL